MPRIALITTAFLLTACQSIHLVDTTSEAASLLETDWAFSRLSEASNPKTAFAAHIAPDGMMLPRASAGAIEGYDNVIAAFGAADDPGYQLLWQPQYAEVAEAGDMGWTWGQYQVLVDGAEISTGKYVNVWKKQADGSWKVRVDLGNERPKQAP